MSDFKLSEYMSFYEMTRTNHRRLLDENRREARAYLQSGIALAKTLCDPIREHFGAPMVCHSGFRCQKLNAAIGGSATSQHPKFEAIDFHIHGVDLTEVFEWIYQDSGLEFGQLILEGWSEGEPSWIHISLGAPYRPANKCGQVLTWLKDRGYQRVR